MKNEPILCGFTQSSPAKFYSQLKIISEKLFLLYHLNNNSDLQDKIFSQFNKSSVNHFTN